MRFRHAVAVAVAAGTLLGAESASARVAHTVQPGETLWSIAAASNFTTRALAAANGLPETANVVAGQTIWIPSEAEAASALAGAAPATGTAPAPEPMGAYTVQPGDTLSGIAARSGVDVGAVAAMNGLSIEGPLLAGTALKLPTGSPVAAQPSPAPTTVPEAAPQPTGEFVSPDVIHQVAADHGVPGSLAAAIAKQESGFNNNMVSPANARGVMQILPGTWDFIQSNLASQPLNPASAHDNVHAGVMYLGQLLRDTGGDEAAATAAYYQGLSSVQNQGLLPETQRYVDNVMALRAGLGGP
jgi:N-acetylmuramoyl-L-alanine amidase